MFPTPSIDELVMTLQDPSSPIGKRMRAACYAKQQFLDEQEKKNQTNILLSKKDIYSHGNNDDTSNGNNVTDILLQVLCEQVFVKEHGSLLRHEFAYVLGQMQTQKACTALEELLCQDDDCVMVRHEAAEALGAIASPHSLTVLQTIRDKYQGILPELSDTCLLAIQRIQAEQGGEMDSRMVVGCACMMAPFYSSIDPATANPEQHAKLTDEELGDVLLDTHETIVNRYQAMFSLRNRGTLNAVKQLCRALVKDESSALLRHEVAFVLGQLQHPASVDALEESLSRKHEHTMVRHEAAEALGAIETTSSEQWQRIESILQKYQQDDDLVVAESCIVALDAADYFATFTNCNVEADDDKDDNDEDGIAMIATGATTGVFGAQKHHQTSNDAARKRLLEQHFNIATTTTTVSSSYD